MQCPVCDQVTLREVEKNGVMIDICPACKGVWLDRGELDKLMQDVHEAHKEYDYLQSQAAMPKPHKPSQAPYPNQYDHMPHQSHSPSPGYYGEQQAQYNKKPYYKDNHHSPYQKQDYQIGYDKYGRPYKKKKKTVFNMLEDLFD